MSLFQGKPMIIHLGGTSTKTGQSQTASTRLFHIRQSSSGATRAVEVGHLPPRAFHQSVLPNPSWLNLFSAFPQVEASASNLNSNDVFVLKTPRALFVWRGAGATDEEMAASRHVTGFLGGNPSQVAEGKEPGEPLFYWTSNQAALDATQATVTLFRFPPNS